MAARSSGELRRADVVHVFSASYFSFLLAPLPAILVARALGSPVAAELPQRRGARSPPPVRGGASGNPRVPAQSSCRRVPGRRVRRTRHSGASHPEHRGSRSLRVPGAGSAASRDLSPRETSNPCTTSRCTLRAFRLVQDEVPGRHTDAGRRRLAGTSTEGSRGAPRSRRRHVRWEGSRPTGCLRPTRTPTSTCRLRTSTTCPRPCSRRSQAARPSSRPGVGRRPGHPRGRRPRPARAPGRRRCGRTPGDPAAGTSRRSRGGWPAPPASLASPTAGRRSAPSGSRSIASWSRRRPGRREGAHGMSAARWLERVGRMDRAEICVPRPGRRASEDGIGDDGVAPARVAPRGPRRSPRAVSRPSRHRSRATRRARLAGSAPALSRSTSIDECRAS